MAIPTCRETPLCGDNAPPPTLLAATTSVAYNNLGQRASVTDPLNRTTTYTYDTFGRPKDTILPDGTIFRTEPDTTWQSYTYDLAGRLLVHRKADGKTKTHIYGDPDRDFLTQVNYSNGEPSRLMEYDRLGRLTKASNGSSMVTRSYDEAGRLTGETQALTGGPTGSFVYDFNYATDDGNLASHTRPDGSQIDYAWNARNLLAGITSDAPPPVATYSYNARNQIASTIIENELFTATRDYDNAGRLTGISNGTLDTTSYLPLTPDGRRETITRNGDTENYGYDNARQVTSGTYGGLSTTQSWNYDPAGNRLTAVTNGSTTTYQANAVNEYFSITGGGHVPPAPTYDDNGNATTWNVRPQGSFYPDIVGGVFAWNINNELTSATNSTGDAAAYTYDALGRRVKRVETINGVTTTTWFFYNGWNVELEHNGTTYTRRHTWGLDLSNSLQGAGGVGGLVMVEHLDTGSDPEPYFPTYDGNGNITAWVDATGTVVARQRYDAFGNILSQTGIAPSNYAFSTKPIERVTGLYYYGYRHYDPITGRWPSRDPIEERGGINLYGFAGNNSINFGDKAGLAVFVVTALPADDKQLQGDANQLRITPEDIKAVDDFLADLDSVSDAAFAKAVKDGIVKFNRQKFEKEDKAQYRRLVEREKQSRSENYSQGGLGAVVQALTEFGALVTEKHDVLGLVAHGGYEILGDGKWQATGTSQIAGEWVENEKILKDIVVTGVPVLWSGCFRDGKHIELPSIVSAKGKVTYGTITVGVKQTVDKTSCAISFNPFDFQRVRANTPGPRELWPKDADTTTTPVE